MFGQRQHFGEAETLGDQHEHGHVRIVGLDGHGNASVDAASNVVESLHYLSLYFTEEIVISL